MILFILKLQTASSSRPVNTSDDWLVNVSLLSRIPGGGSIQYWEAELKRDDVKIVAKCLSGRFLSKKYYILTLEYIIKAQISMETIFTLDLWYFTSVTIYLPRNMPMLVILGQRNVTGNFSITCYCVLLSHKVFVLLIHTLHDVR